MSALCHASSRHYYRFSNVEDVSMGKRRALSDAVIEVSSGPAPMFPAKMPRGACFVASVHRGSNRWGELIDDFNISTIRSRSHWLLWECGDNQYDDTRYAEVRGWCLAKGVERKEAASALLLAWFQEAREMWNGHYDEKTYVVSEGILSAEEVNQLLTQALSTSA
jgi:hypothetical protein